MGCRCRNNVEICRLRSSDMSASRWERIRANGCVVELVRSLRCSGCDVDGQVKRCRSARLEQLAENIKVKIKKNSFIFRDFTAYKYCTITSIAYPNDWILPASSSQSTRHLLLYVSLPQLHVCISHTSPFAPSPSPLPQTASQLRAPERSPPRHVHALRASAA